MTNEMAKQVNFIFTGKIGNQIYVAGTIDGQNYTGHKNKRPFFRSHVSLFEELQKAYDFERYLKSGSGQAFMKRHLE